jgi:glutamyl-tRNA reductase
MTKKLTIGVAGLGLLGEVRARNIAQLPNAHLYAVASRRPEVAQEVAQRYGADRFYTDYLDLFNDPNLDAVIISTAIVEPCRTHHPGCRAWVEHFCGKAGKFFPGKYRTRGSRGGQGQCLLSGWFSTSL